MMSSHHCYNLFEFGFSDICLRSASSYNAIYFTYSTFNVHNDTWSFAINVVRTAANCNKDAKMFTFQLYFALIYKSRHPLTCKCSVLAAPQQLNINTTYWQTFTELYMYRIIKVSKAHNIKVNNDKIPINRTWEDCQDSIAADLFSKCFQKHILVSGWAGTQIWFLTRPDCWKQMEWGGLIGTHIIFT